MATVYILYSSNADKYYIGSTKDFAQRMDYHQTKAFTSSFTAKYSDWELFFSIDVIDNAVARKIESHIKRMKSRAYIQNIKSHIQISQRLIQKYSK